MLWSKTDHQEQKKMLHGSGCDDHMWQGEADRLITQAPLKSWQTNAWLGGNGWNGSQMCDKKEKRFTTRSNATSNKGDLNGETFDQIHLWASKVNLKGKLWVLRVKVKVIWTTCSTRPSLSWALHPLRWRWWEILQTMSRQLLQDFPSRQHWRSFTPGPLFKFYQNCFFVFKG